MKTFINKILIFLLIGFLPLGIVYSIISYNHSFLPNSMYYSNEFNKAFKNGNYELIAIGNSKLLASLSGNILNKELGLSNAILGYSSSDMSISKLTLKSYLDICEKTPKYLLLEVSWFSFNNKRTGFHSIDGDLFLADPLLLRYLIRYYPKSFYDIFDSLKMQIISKSRIIAYTDYNSRHQDKDKSIKTYKFDKSSFYKIFPNQKAGIDSFLLDDFYDIIETCDKNNIKVILYTAPEDEEYTNYQKDRDSIYKVFYDVSKKQNVEYLNYTKGGELYKKQYENWLSNSHHLNEKELFTKVLIKDIKKVQIHR